MYLHHSWFKEEWSLPFLRDLCFLLLKSDQENLLCNITLLSINFSWKFKILIASDDQLALIRETSFPVS